MTAKVAGIYLAAWMALAMVLAVVGGITHP
jgi:hypothetical protein